MSERLYIIPTTMAVSALLISVVIPVLNDGERLARCLEAVTLQTYPPGSIETIVVDNGSREDIRGVTDRFPGVTYLREPAPGPAAARNAGAALAKGAMLAFTDADCIPEPAWLERGARRLAGEKGCGIVGGRIDMVFADADKPTASELYDSVTYLQQRRHVEQSRFAATANMFCLKSVFDAVGGFDTRFPGASGEDFELGLRVHDAGWGIVYSDEARVAHPAVLELGTLLGKTRRIRDGLRRLESIRGLSRSPLRATARALSSPFWLCALILREDRIKTARAKAAVCLVALYVYFASLIPL
jgi:GT2 family glycosyltransferase